MLLKIKTYRDEEPYRMLNEIRKLYNDAQSEYDFKKIGEQNKIFNTVWALVILSFRLGQISEAILSSKGYYAGAILYRSLIEYTLKHLYLGLYSETGRLA